MRHGKKFNHLSRTSSHRKAMLSNMASSLILKKRIKTTVAKAKALRQYVEPLLTKAKNDTTHSRRTVFRYLQNKYSVQELFGDVAMKIAERPGGYTRILKTGNRLGDNAEMCIIELVDYNENLMKTEKPAKARTRRGRSKKKEAKVEETVVAEAAVETEGVTEEADTTKDVSSEDLEQETEAIDESAETEEISSEEVATESEATEPASEAQSEESETSPEQEPEEKKLDSGETGDEDKNKDN